MIKGVIFDLDGVLVTTDEFHYQAWNKLAEDEGIPFTREDNHRQRGISRAASLDVLLEKSPRAYSQAEKDEMMERKNNTYRKLLDTLTPDDLLPNALEMVRALRKRGIKVAVGSASRNTPAIMKQVGLDTEVDAVADGNDAKNSKPDPEVFLLAAERLGLEPSECLVVEDAPAGVEAGRRGGMAVFAIGPKERHPDVPNRAETLADVTPDELLAAG